MYLNFSEKKGNWPIAKIVFIYIKTSPKMYLIIVNNLQYFIYLIKPSHRPRLLILKKDHFICVT